MIKYFEGNLFNSNAPVLAHGINCFGFMRAGIATEFSSRYPDMYEAYRLLCKARSIKPGEVFFWTAPGGQTIANVASQYKPGADARYSWTITGLGKVVEFCESNNLKGFAMPRMACGIGGLDWEVLERKLQREFGNSPIDVEVWTL